MITPFAVRPEPPGIQQIETQAMTVQADQSRDSMERDLARFSYFSPVTRIDVETQKAVLQYRNAQTGDVERQYPSKERLKAYAVNGTGAGPAATGPTTVESRAQAAGAPEAEGGDKHLYA